MADVTRRYVDDQTGEMFVVVPGAVAAMLAGPLKKLVAEQAVRDGFRSAHSEVMKVLGDFDVAADRMRNGGTRREQPIGMNGSVPTDGCATVPTMSTVEAAAQLCRSDRWVRQLCVRRDLAATRAGVRWRITAVDLAAYLKEHR